MLPAEAEDALHPNSTEVVGIVSIRESERLSCLQVRGSTHQRRCSWDWFLFRSVLKSCEGSNRERHFTLLSLHPIRMEKGQDDEVSRMSGKTES